MFRISRRVDYATRILLALAIEGRRLTLREVREQMHIPPQFAKQILAALIQAHLLRTKRGPGGGLELARPAEQITLRHVLEAIEGPLMISECIHQPHTCPLSLHCPVRRRWAQLQSVIVAELEAATLRTLAEEHQNVSFELRPVEWVFTLPQDGGRGEQASSLS